MGLCKRLRMLPLEHVTDLELSLHRIDAIDTSGVAALVRLYSHLSRCGKRLTLIDVSERVYACLADIGLSRVIHTARKQHQASTEIALEASGLHDRSGLF